MKPLELHCHKCKQIWEAQPPLGRRDECPNPNCHADARCCLNCRHYDSGTHHECREEQAEWVKEKTQGNFCGWFEPGSRTAATSEAKAALGKLGQFFKGATEIAVPAANGGVADELRRFLAAKK